MADPYIGEIRMFGGNFAPVGWALCSGQLLSIAEHNALYNLIGTTYGGDGLQTFALPDLRGRAPVHQGINPLTRTTFVQGENSGTETVTLITPQMPAHRHTVRAQSGGGTSGNPTGETWASSTINAYSTGTPDGTMHSGALSAAGGSMPHNNMMPSLTINFIIALEGIYPTQN